MRSLHGGTTGLALAFPRRRAHLTGGRKKGSIMSKPQSPADFKSALQPEVPGLSYWLPEAPKRVEKTPAPQPLTALEQMFDYFS